ncbi:DUF4347 domain-containing protein [Mariniblastus fucicola]|uniref:DUF4347 domain-containing protein n=1 Tax=Mariniblastus fucicola TaxID=980251 RepID=A0A5B9PC82_9BACT|nr:DUF4347 domain-containing protein [Mariniblastus fucicola]QEG22775.1 hypothetical protein MFFC18_26580 [Mariniblastus fucicola]
MFQNDAPKYRSLFESLEERVLFDGAPDAAFAYSQNQPVEPVPAQVQKAASSQSQGASQLIVIDSGVEDTDALLNEILKSRHAESFEVLALNPNQDGVAQISELLEQSKGKYSAIHIVSHGDEGQVHLGDLTLSSNNITKYADQLAGWADALTEDADLLFYGCDLAGNAEGEQFIESISAITGTDVAASDDLTGDADQGGDWDLEFTTGFVTTEFVVAPSYEGLLALSDATLNIVSDGTPTWDTDNNAGNDTDGSNGIIRTHDIISMEVFYNTDAGGATDLNFTSTLPEGLVWNSLPAAAALDPRSMIVDSVTGLEGGDLRGIIAYLPDVAGTFTSSIVFEARALGGEQGTPLNGVEFDVNSNENTAAIDTDAYDFTLSSAANMDIELRSPTFRGVFTDASGTVDGVVYSYGIGIYGDHPTRTGSDAVKGSAPIEDNFTFDIDLSGVTPGAQVFDWGTALGGTAEAAIDGISRNYERYVNSSGNTVTGWSQSNRPSGQTDEHTGNVWNEERSTPDSGDWTITGSAGSVYSVQVSGADTTGSHFPSNYGGGGVVPAADNWFTSSIVHVWIPIDEILPGEDGIGGNEDDGALDITPVITNFDPDDYWGTTNNFGSGVADTEDTSNNDYTHTVVAASVGGPTKHNATAGHPTSGRWVETSSNWNAGDGETSLGHIFDSRVNSGRNLGVLSQSGVIWGDKIDNTATKITANSLAAQSGDGWSRAYVSGGPSSGTFLTYGVDYIIEFGTGGVGGAAGGWTDWNSMGDATLADGESPVWSEDPTDVALGGNAYADGVRDSITKYRFKLLRDLEPGEAILGFVSHEVVGASTLDPANNPDGRIIANFVAGTADYLLTNANPNDDWRTSEYDPQDNSWYAEGASSDLWRGDRLYLVEANVDVDKLVVDLGAGNNYLAGSAATIQLDATVTIPGPDSGAPAQDVYVTDMLPAGLTVIGGSAQPTAGFAFTAGDGSTVSVQSVEYYDPATSSWSTTWSYGSTGIRWYFGDVPLNTSLPTMTFDVLVPYDAQNGENWTNTAVISSPSDSSPEDLRNSSAGIVAVQVAAMAAGKQVVTPLVAEDSTIIYELGIANVSDDKDVPWFDLVDVLPYDADFQGSSHGGQYTFIDVTNLAPDLEVYVTSTAATTLDAQDGTVDGYADPGTSGDSWFVAEGTGIWQYTLNEVQSGAAGAPAINQITAIRVVSDKTVDPILAAGESTDFLLHLTPDGNEGIPSDTYTNKFTARTDPGALPLPVNSAPVTAVVVAPDIEIEKEVALDETHVNIDPTDDSHWGETVNFDDTDKAYFRLKVTNTGTADFLGATVSDSLPAGSTFVAGTAVASAGDVSGFPSTWTFDLPAGETAYLIYQLDVNDEGNYVNSADVEATDQFGETVNDSDDAEANFVTEISAAKQQTGAVRSSVNPDFFEVTYEVEFANTSIFDLTEITLTEDLTAAFGPGFQGIVTAPVITSSSISAGGSSPTINGAFDGSGDTAVLNADGVLLPTDSVTITYTVNVDPALLPDPANTVNQVEAGGVTGGPGGTPTTDLSDDGSDPTSDNPDARGDDGMGGTDDPTPLVLPAVDLTKQIVGSPVPSISGNNGNFDVTYEFMIENTGTTDLDNISMIEDFIANLGGAFQGIVSGPRVTMTTATDNPDFNPNYDGDTDTNVFLNTPAPNENLLEVGQKFTFEITVEIDPDDPGAIYDGITGDGDGSLENQASVTAEDRYNGVPVADTSDDPTDLTDAEYGDDSDPDDPTSLLFPNIELTKAIIGTPVPASSGTTGNMDVTFEFVITNSGNESLDNISLIEDLATQYGGAFQRIVPQGVTSAPAVVTFTDGTNPVEINSSFDGGASDAELIDNAGGINELAMGETIRIQIVVEVDPDNATALYTSGMLVNQATVTGEGSTSGIVTDDDSDDPNDATNDDNDADNDPDDPTTWQVPIVDLTKTLIGDPVAASSGTQGNFDVTYNFEITNFGNAPLDMLSLQEDVAAQYGTAFIRIVPQGTSQATIQASSMTDAPEINGSYDGGISDAEVFDNSGSNTNLLAMGESVRIRIVFEVDPNAVGANLDANNYLVNQATVSGNHNGTTYSDDSDDPNNGDDVDPNGDNNADDPNTLFIADVSVAKEVAGTPTPLANGNFNVTYQLVVENTGNASLDISLEDDLDAQFGSAFVSAGSLTMISQPAGNPITLDSANWDGDVVTEMVNQSFTNILEGGEFFIVQIEVEVDPDASGRSQALDNQATVTGDAVDENGLPLTDSNGDPVIVDDLSDTGSDPETSNPGADGDTGGSDDPTPLLLPDVAIAKSIVGDPVQLPNGHFTVQYQFVVENIGTTYLSNLQVVEDFAAEFGANVFVQVVAPPAVNGLPMDPTSVAPIRNIPYDGNADANLLDGTSGLLAPGDSYSVGVTVQLDPNGAGAIVPFENTAVTTGDAANPDGSPISDGSGSPIVVTDDSDSGTNPNTSNSGEPGDTGGTDDPTPLYIADLDITKAIVGGPTLLSNGNHSIDYSVVVENTGSVDLANLSLIEDLQAQFGAGFQNATGLTIGTAPTDAASTVTLDSNWDGTTALSEMVDSGVASLLAIGDSFTIEFTVEVDASSLPAATAPTVFTSEAAFASSTQATLREDFTDIVGNTSVDLSLGPFVSSLGGVEISGTIVSSVGTGAETRQDADSFDGGAPDDGVFVIRQIDGGSANLRITVPNPGNAIGFVFADVFDPAGGAPAGEWTYFKATASDGTVMYEHDERTDGDLPANFARFIGIQGTGSQVYTHIDIEYETSGNDNWTIDHIYDSGNANNVITNQIDGSGDAVDDSGNPITDSNGDPVVATDESDSGSNPDDENSSDPGNSGSHNDPTPLVIPEVSLAKDAGDTVANGDNWDVSFILVYENTGTTDLNNLTLVDDVASQFGNAFVSASGLAIQNFSGTGTSPTANTAWETDTTLNMLTGGAADVGDSFEIVFTVTIDPDGLDSLSQPLDNTAVAGGDALDENGDPILDGTGNPVTVTDESDDGTDVNGENGDDNGDGTFANDPTPVIIADIGVAKQVVNQPTLLANGNFEATYQLVVENTGTVDLANLSLDDDIAAQFGIQFVNASGLTLTTAPADADSSVVLDSANWDGNGVTEMVNTTIPSLLAVGDSFVVQFTVEIDPDAGGTASGPLENQVAAGGIGVDEDGNTYTDSNGDPVTADDLSDDGTDPSADNAGSPGDHGTSDDPTPIYIPAIGLAKEASDAVTNGDNWDVDFTFVIENTGTVDLNNLDLIDDIAAEFGNAFVSASGLTVQNFVGTGTAPGANSGWESDTTLNMLDGTGQLNVGDTFEVTFTITIDPDGIDSVSQTLDNQGTITGDALDENGDPIDDGIGGTLQANDGSDNGTDPNSENGEDDGDGTFGNDPTPIIIADVSVTKETVGTPVQLANDNFLVDFQLVIENTGTVHLADMTLIDDIDMQFGNAFVNAGSLTVVAGPGDADSNIVLDIANWDGDTVIEMLNQAIDNQLAVGDSFVVQFTVEVDPDATGTSGYLENQATVAGDAVDDSGIPFTNSNGDPITTTDESDSGADPSSTNTGADGDTGGSDDPTPLLLPALSVGKQANTVTVPVIGGVEITGAFDVQYLVVLENTGTVELTNLQLTDDLTTLAHFGDAYDATFIGTGTMDRSGLVVLPAIVSHTLADPADQPILDPAFLGGAGQTDIFDGMSGALLPGEQIVVAFTVRIDGLELTNTPAATNGVGGNQVTGTADSDSGPVTDESDNGLDPNTDNGDGGTDDFTPFEVPQIRLWKSHSDSVGNPDGTSTITVELKVENTGTVPLSNLTLSEDVASQFGAAFVSATDPTITSPPSNALSLIPSSLINPNWNTDTSQDVFNSAVTGESLAAGDEFTISFDVTVDPDLLDDDSDYLNNSATVMGDGVNYNMTVITVSDESGVDDGSGFDSDEPTPAIVAEIAVVKAARDAIPNGEDWDVSFTLVVENTGSTDLNDLTLFDDVAAQFGNAFVGATGLTVQNFVGSGTVPTSNGAWTGDTTQSMISGGFLNPGDRFEVVFTVTIDPDGIDSISQGLDNQATVNGDAIDDMGNPLTDENGDDIVATDDSDSGTDPQGTNPDGEGDEGTNEDPTPIIIADVSIAKEVVGQPTLLSNGNYAIDYQLVVENIGTVHLSDMTLVDDIQAQFGAAVFQNVSGLGIVSGPTDPFSSITLDSINWDGTVATDILNQTFTNTLAIGDTFTFEFTVEINAAAATGVLDNQATVGGTGVDEDGNVYADENGDDITATDDSDSGAMTGDSNTGEPGDTGGSDDPTPLYIPNIGIAKDAGDAVANGDDFDVTFTLNWENTGTIALDNVDILDDIAAQFGSQFVSVTLDSVTAGTGNTGSTPTANAAWETDTSLSLINSTGPLNVGDTLEIVFTVTIDPDATGTSSPGLENQATTSGEGLDENGDPLLNPDGSPVTVTDESDDGLDPTSENGDDDGDGTFGNDPTPVIIADIRVTKAVAGTPTLLANGNYSVAYELDIENTGNVNLADLTLVEDLSAHFGTAYVGAGSLTLSSGPSNASSSVVLETTTWNGGASTEMIDQSAATLLVVGDSFKVQFTVEVDPDAVGAPGALDNQVVVGGDAVDSNGDPITDSNGDEIVVTDDSDSGTDPNTTNSDGDGDTGGSDDPTPLLLPSVSLAKEAGDAVANGDNWDVSFTFVYENTGTVDLANLSLTDDITLEFGNAFVGVVPGSLLVQNFAGSGTAPGQNAAWESDTTLDMLDGTGQLNIGDSFEVTFTVTIDPDGIDSVSQSLENQGVANADGINPDTGTADPDLAVSDDSDNGTDVHGENGEDDGDGTFGNDPTPVIIADVSIAKEVIGQPALLSNGNFAVDYQLVVENIGTVHLSDMTLADDIQAQFGTSVFQGVSNLAIVTGPTDSFSSITMDPANWDGTGATDMLDQSTSNSLAIGDSFVFEFTVEVDATAATGILDNQATVGGTGVDGDGNPYTDSNGNEITGTDDSDSGATTGDENSGEPGDTGGSDDPTPLYIPNVGIAKDAGDAVANGDNFDVTFTLVWENTGTVALDNVDIMDDIAAQFGGQFVQVVPGSLGVVNFMGSGAIPSANMAWEGDTTQSLINDNGALEVGDTFEVVFTVTIDPDFSGTSLTGLENQAATSGEGLDENGNPLTNPDGSPVTVTDESDDGLDPISENGEDDGDGTFGNDPTPVIIADISVTKAVAGMPTLLANGNYSVVYELDIENTGNVDLADLTLNEDLSAHFGTAFVSAGSLTLSSPPFNASSNVVLETTMWDGGAATEMIDQSAATLLAVGDSFKVQFTVEVDPDAIGAPGALDNQVVVGGDAVDSNGDPITDSNGDPIEVTDDSDSGTDPNTTNSDGDGDTGGSDDPTPLLLPSVSLAKQGGDAVANGDNWDVSFTFFYENTGTVDLTNLSLTDDIATEFGNAFVGVVPGSLLVGNFAGSGTAPGQNAAWEADTTLDMLDGFGQLNIGDSFEVTFTVTIDPDGVDSASQGLENQGVANADGINPDTGAPDPDLAVSDDSDNGTDVHGENGEDDGDGTFGNDPTPIIIADIGLSKEIIGSPTLLSNGNFEIVYQLVAENTGTVDLASLSLVDDLDTQFGPGVLQGVSGLTLVTQPADPFSSIVLDPVNWDGTATTDMVNQSVSTSLVVGDSFIVQFTVEVDAVAATGVLDNQATTSGDAVDEDGNPYTDSNGDEITATDDSDSGADPSTDNAGEPGDSGGTDDPTPLYIPNIGIAKDAGDAVPNGDNFDVEFTLVWENTGTVALDKVDILDDIAAQFGGQFVQVVPGSLTVENFAGTGSAPTANAAWEGDTTLSLINSTGSLNIGDTFEVVFTVTIDPDFSGTASPGLENQATTSGEGLDENGDPLLDDSGDPITVTDESDDGVDPTTENGEDDGDGTFGNDPTPIIIPDISVVKTSAGSPVALDNGNFDVVFELTVENTGNVDLADLSLIEDLSAHFGTAFINARNLTLITGPGDANSSVALDSGWDGTGTTEMVNQTVATLLAVGDSYTVQFNVEVDPNAIGAPATLENQVVTSGNAVDENGDPIEDSSGNPITTTDDSDDGTDPNGTNPNDQGDNGTSDDPTPLLIPDVALAKQAGDAVANGDNWDVTFTLVVENTGTVALDNLTLMDDIAAEFGNAYVSASGLAVQNFVGTGTAPVANAAWMGDTTQNMLDGTGSINVGDTYEVVFTVTIDPDGIDNLSQALENQAVTGGDGVNPDGTPMTDGSGNPVTATDDSDNGTDPSTENGEDDMDGVVENDPTPIYIADIGVAKQPIGTPVMVAGGNYEISYQLVIENTGTVDLQSLSLVEDLAAQYGSVFQSAFDLTLTNGPTDLASSITLDTAWNGASMAELIDQTVPTFLAIGDSFTVEFTVEVDPSLATGALENQVMTTGVGVDENGDPIIDSNGDTLTASDVSDSGTDPNGNNPDGEGDSGGSDDPTPLQIPSIGIAKSAGDAVANGENFDVEFTLVVENNGTTGLNNLELFDDIATQFDGQFVSASGLTVQNFTGAGFAPTANTAWESDTTENMLTGGELEIGDSFEVVFTITIDPDATGMAMPLDNQAVVAGDAIDENGDPITDSNGDVLEADDTSDNGVDPNGENGEDEDGDGTFGNDPTPIIIADIAVAKTAAGTPVALDNGNFEVTYEVVVANTGTVDLASLSVLEDLATQFGANLVSAGNLTVVTAPSGASSIIAVDSAWNGDTVAEMVDQTTPTLLAVGDSFAVQFMVEVDLDATGTSGPLDNQVVATGDGVDEEGIPYTDSNGNPIDAVDQSDSGTNPTTDNGNDQGDNGSPSDPTPLLIPDIAVVKSAGLAVPNGDNWDVTFTLLVENTGTVTLENLSLMDDIAAEIGNAFLETSGVTIQNYTGTGTAPIANGAWSADTSQNMLAGGTLDIGDSYEAVFTVTIDPDGIDSISQGLTNQAVAEGDGVNPDGTPMEDSSGNPVTTSDDSDNGVDPNGENAEDNGDGIVGNDVTPIIIADIALAKSIVGSPELLSNGNHEVTYQLVVENIGTVDLDDLSLLEDVASHFDAGFISAGGLTITSPTSGLHSSIAIDLSFDGDGLSEMMDTSAANLLEVGDSFTLEFSVEVDASALPPSAENTVTANAIGIDENGDAYTDPSGNPITATDDSDSGTDPSTTNIDEPGDAFGSDDPTPLWIPSIGLGKSAGDAVANGQNWDVTFTLVYENNGTVALNNLTLFDDIAAQFGAASADVRDLSVENFSGTGTIPTANTGWEANTSQSMISGGQLDAGDSFEVTYTVTINPDATGTSGLLDNQATAEATGIDNNGNPLVDSSGNPMTATDVSDHGVDANGENGEASPDGTYGNDPTPIHIADLGIAKSIVGEPQFVDGHYLVTYQLIVENTGTVDLTNLSLNEDLAGQFGDAYVNASELTLIGSPGDPQSSIALNSAFDGGSNTELMDVSANNVLQTGDSFLLQFVAEVNPNSEGDELHNQVTGSGDAIDENGDPIVDGSGEPLTASDFSDGGTDPNGSNPGTVGDSGSWSDTTIFTTPRQGAAGNPPRFPGLPPVTNNLLGSYLNAPGPIYSGIPMSMSNPVTLESGRPIGGGYSGDGTGGMQLVECCEVVDACPGQPVEVESIPVDEDFGCDATVPVEARVVEDCGCEELPAEVLVEERGESVIEEVPCEEAACDVVPMPCPKPHFLQRMKNWLSR